MVQCGICGMKQPGLNHFRVPEKCIAAMIVKFQQERRRWRKMAVAMANLPPAKIDVNGNFEFSRAGGDVPCATCGLAYYDHPSIPDFPTFHVICDGKRVKL